VWTAALRRLAGLFVLAAGITAFVSLSFALLLGESVSRAVSVGFYLVGAFLTIAGFFVGNRGPVRLKRDVGVPLLGSRFVRWATPEEREESINTSAIYVVLGFALIFLGVLADTRYSLV
jgi:hypothetical protein